MVTAANLRHGRFLTVAAIFRSQISMKDVEEKMQKTQRNNSANFAERIPNIMLLAHGDIVPHGTIFSSSASRSTTTGFVLGSPSRWTCGNGRPVSCPRPRRTAPPRDGASAGTAGLQPDPSTTLPYLHQAAARATLQCPQPA
ncbi:hypothetical protein B0H14DRAFT_2876302 [Mycena olivaceomarginata]|nr:hypothetical protein B0H14DRAFT_2876302 [Mycena olivaceomarginata]